MDQEERQRKLEAGRAKLAHFRQRRAKSDGAKATKKTPKRKSQTLQTDDWSAQNCHLVDEEKEEGETKTVWVNGQKTKNDFEESQQFADIADTLACQSEQAPDPADTKARSILPGDRSEEEEETIETADPLGEIIVTHTSKEQLKQLQAAVEKRNEIISQLSINLQAALMSRDQVQLEAQQLTDQIQELQQQLQQAKEYLRSKSLGWLEMAQAQQSQTLCKDDPQQQITKEPEDLLAQKETEITVLQQKLGVMEDSLSQLQNTFILNKSPVKSTLLHNGNMLSGSVPSPEGNLDIESDTLLQRLKTDLLKEQQNSQQEKDRAESLQKIVMALESQHVELKAQLRSVQADLERSEKRCWEMQRYEDEKEKLNPDVAHLKSLVQELQDRLRKEEDTGVQLRTKHEAELANYELQLQTLEEERGLNIAQLTEAHEAAFKNLKEEHTKEMRRIQKLLERIQQHKHLLVRDESSEELGLSLNQIKPFQDQSNDVTTNGSVAQDDLCMDTSLISTEDQIDLMDRYLATAVQRESSWLEQSMEERKFDSHTEVVLSESGFSIHYDSHDNNPAVTENQPTNEGGMSFTHVHWQSLNSTSKDTNGARSLDLGNEQLIQQFTELTIQLEEKEKQLEVLQEEVQRSAEEVEEARERWGKASEELEEVKWELQTEREKRLYCEELISQKTHEQDNLKNKLSFLESQQVLPQDTAELLKELQGENLRLMMQLKQPEQLVCDIKEQKGAGDSVSNGTEALFGEQLSSLQVQRDQLLAQLESLGERNQDMSVLLGQRMLEVESANKENKQLQVEAEERTEYIQKLEKIKVDLEARLVCLEENITSVEEVLSQRSEEKAALKNQLQAMTEQIMSMETVLKAELEDFEVQLEAKTKELEEMKVVVEKAEHEHMEKESTMQKELEQLREKHEHERRAFEEKHEKEVQDWALRLEKELSVLRCNLEEEQKKQISLIKQVHEREYQRELSQQAAQHREELEQLKAELSDEMRDSLEAAHQAELAQAQSQKMLELEALRLSLTNMHTAQLELTQSNLQKEKEAALTELQTNLREKWAQESAMLQTRQQFELERLREQSRERDTQIQLQHQQEITDLKSKCEQHYQEERTSVVKQQDHKLEELKEALCKAETSLTEAQQRIDELQCSKEEVVKHLERELNQAWADRDSAARAVEELVATHKLVLQEQQSRVQKLEEKEKQLQHEVDHLLEERESQKFSHEQEVSNLWSQLDSMRTSRQELGELKEQLLARSSRVDDIERLKQEFSQQRRELQEQNEVELENLRTYFEQRLRASEENHREEIALLQLRLVEGALEDSILQTEDAGAEEDRSDALAEINEQLDKHKLEIDMLRLQLEEKHKQDLEQLRCRMALSYKEELLQARTELSDRYYSDIEQLNNKHALDIEQLRAKLSDHHLKEITKLRLQSAVEVERQVETELKERSLMLNEEHEDRLAQLASEAERILSLEKQLAQLTLQHIQELEQTTKQHTEEMSVLEERLKKTFAEELQLHLEKAQREERTRVSEDLQAQTEERLTSLREELQTISNKERIELENKLSQTQELLSAETKKLGALQASLNSEESAQVLAMKQKLQAQYDSELRTAKAAMAAEVKELNALLQQQAEAKLQEAVSRHQDEQKHLTETLTQQREADLTQLRLHHDEELEAQRILLEQHISKLQELRTSHQEELDLLSTNHKAALDSLEAELSRKHSAELDKLQMIFEETNTAQLKAQEAELVARHQLALDELETRMLCNMDTLEATYLKEIQAVQEEKKEEVQQLRASLEQQHAEQIERVRDELRRELAQVHMDKFSAMATELRQAHQSELCTALASQKAAFEADQHSTLETLRLHVLNLEKQHSAALQEITGMSSTEKQQLQQQLDALNVQHQDQLQKLKETSARELEALQRKLEEQLSQQRLHFLKEAELLKSNSEEQIQIKSAQMKEIYEQEKITALDLLEKSLQKQRQQDDLRYKDKINQLNDQLQQLDALVSKLREELSGLQDELEGKRSEMETLDTLLQRRERESQEGANLLSMLRDDLNTATQQRQNLHKTHERLQKVLLEMLQVTITTEEQISIKLGLCADDSISNRTPRTCPDPKQTVVDVEPVEDGVNCSMFSSVMDEGLELSQRLCESLFSGPEGELDSEKEELVLGACNRLRTAVDKLLELVSESTQQMEQVRALQVLLNEQFNQGGEARNSLLVQHSQLLEQLDQEAALKNQLELELHKAEGLIEGYVAEKAVLDEALQQKEVREQRLVEELENTRTQLQKLSEEHTLLQRQRDALSSDLGEPEKALLAEAERLGQERVDVQRQADKDRLGLAARLRLLELSLEERESQLQQQEEQHRIQAEDLQQHIDALEKQQKHHRQFIDEQAVEREHERDEFQQEIKNLEAQLRMSSKGHLFGDGNGQRVESLQALIKDKTEDYSLLLSAKEECQRDLEERNEEIDKMACRIRELEQALLSSTEAGRMVTQLEQELQRSRKSLQDLSEDKEALQQQLYSNKLQISALQSKLDETRHRIPDSSGETGLQEQLETLQQDLQSKADQTEVLLERIEELEKSLAVKDEDIRQFTLQLELKTQESRGSEETLQLHITELEETIATLRRKEQEHEDDSALQLPVALLEEKNLEIDHLNQQILHLQRKLQTTKENKTAVEKHAEIEELRAQVERLHGDQERLRQTKKEEIEQLHEVINKLQEELSQLDPNRHEVSDPNTDSSEQTDFPWSPRPQHGTEESLCHELSSQTLQSCRTKLCELKMELEHSTEEKESLQRLLLTQEQQYSEQVEALGRSLGEKRGHLVMLEQEANEMKLQLNEKEAEVQKLKACVLELEDGQKALKDLELRLKRAKEQKKEAQRELAQLMEEAQREKEEREKLEGHMTELQQQWKLSELMAAKLRLQVTDLEKKVQHGRADITALELGKVELFEETRMLQNHEQSLQEEIESLKREVTSSARMIQELNVRLEDEVDKQKDAQKEVLTCAEETLAKAEAALRDREEQLAGLRVEHGALRAELAAVKEGLSTSTERAEKLQEEGQFKDRALADLEEHNERLRAELQGLQDDLEVQEEELLYQQRELEELRQRCDRQEHSEHHGAKPEHRFLEGLSHEASLSSPEVLRRLECTEEPVSRLHASHLSELSTLRNTSVELESKRSPMERNSLKHPLMPHPQTDPPSTRSPTVSPRSLSISENLSVLDSLDAEKVQELEDLDDVTPARSLICSTSPISVPEWVSDGYGSNVSSELEAKLKHELEHSERLDAHFVEYLRGRGMAPAPPSDSAAGSINYNQELLSPELQDMLNRVYEESCRVLSLSHRPVLANQTHSDPQDAPPASWQSERRALQETVLALRELLCRMAEREPKADEADWRAELLQAVRSVFDSERDWLHAQLQDVMTTNTCTDYTALLEQFEKLLQIQGEQQRKSLEQLLSADRSSLLAEIRSLHAQLHSCTLQSQEQLRELQSSLHTAHEHSTQTQLQMHKQVSELEKQLHLEKATSDDLQHRLEEERITLSKQHDQLEAERVVVLELKAGLEERDQLIHSASKKQEELQCQISALRLKLENQEREHQTCVEAVEREQARVTQLQEELNHERVSSQHAQDKNMETQECLRASLSEQASRLTELSGTLDQERVLVSNLRAELQIEQSRCEALLAQERERTEQATARLEAERSRTAELSLALSQQAQKHVHLLEKTRSQESAADQNQKFIQELQAQREQAHRRAEELAAEVERLQAQVLEGKRRQEEEVQQRSQLGQEEVMKLHIALEDLQAQRGEVSRSLEKERLRASQLQTELDAMRQKMREVKEQERLREEQREKQRWREKQEQDDKEWRQGNAKEKLLELEALRERDQQRLKQLQQTLADLELQEKQLTSERLHRELLSTDSTHLNSPASPSSSSLLERVLKENSELAERLAALSEEKISLKHTVSCLERDLQNLKRTDQLRSSAQLDPSLLAEKLTWQKEKAALQAALHRAEDELMTATARNENRPIADLPNNKIQRLYERYLRAESYRKSLVYQKRYLLLLLGGFRDCEQATLALIARMGAHPSLNPTPSSRPISRFRSAVRVVVAINRLKFLTRKWQRVTRKSAAVGGAVVHTAVVRTEVLKPQQSGAYNSPPTRDHIFTQRSVVSPVMPLIKSPFRLHNRAHPSSFLASTERTVTPSQEQEHSLADCIHHLESVQRRLGAIRPGSPAMVSHSRKSDR